jgi:hypothetical protein
MRWIAALFWALTALAGIDMALGNPTAINGVIGAGACAVITTALCWYDRPA